MSEADSGRPTLLLVSNRRLDENAGRAEKFDTRSRLLRGRGWNLEVSYVEPSATGLVRGIVTCIRDARRADVINSVSNPPHLQIAGAVAARVTGTPWLVEFRDPLVENPDIDPDSVSARIRRRLERYLVTHGDKVVWYDGIQIPEDYFYREYADVSGSTFEQLPPIGFETEKFDSISGTSFDEFSITYAGSFYEGWIEPYAFIEGLGRYLEDFADEDVRARFYGDWQSDYDRAVRTAVATSHVESHSFVPHEEIIRVLKGSDVLLYIGGSDPRNRRNLPSKLYDYIGARRPILALVDPSFRIAEVVRENGFGIVVDPDDVEGIRDAIARLVAGDFEFDPDPTDVSSFTRQRSTDAYVEAVESIVEER